MRSREYIFARTISPGYVASEVLGDPRTDLQDDVDDDDTCRSGGGSVFKRGAYAGAVSWVPVSFLRSVPGPVLVLAAAAVQLDWRQRCNAVVIGRASERAIERGARCKQSIGRRPTVKEVTGGDPGVARRGAARV